MKVTPGQYPAIGSISFLYSRCRCICDSHASCVIRLGAISTVPPSPVTAGLIICLPAPIRVILTWNMKAHAAGFHVQMSVGPAAGSSHPGSQTLEDTRSGIKAPIKRPPVSRAGAGGSHPYRARFNWRGLCETDCNPLRCFFLFLQPSFLDQNQHAGTWICVRKECKGPGERVITGRGGLK